MSDDTPSDRHANGRFKEGVCPNPKGRPRKPKIDVREQLTAILWEELPMSSGPITLLEVSLRNLVKEAAKNPKLLIRLLPFITALPSEETDKAASSKEDQAVIRSLLDEEARRDRSKRSSAADDEDEADDPDQL